MLNQSEVLELLDRLAIPSAGQKLILEARRLSPVRKVSSRGGGNVITTFQSRKMLREIGTESRHLEYPAAVSYEHNPDVLEYFPQPCRLKFDAIDDQGEIHQIDHTPDFLVITGDGIFLEEWKSEARLEGLRQKKSWRYQRDPNGEWCVPLIDQWLAEQGIRYRIRSDVYLSPRRVENTMFLEDYLHPSAEECPVDVTNRIRDALVEDPVLYLAEVYEQVECRTDDVFKLIADGLLVADMDGALLSEPNRCRVFRDIAVREFELARQAPSAKPVIPGVLDIRPGVRIRYNNQPYTIALVGGQQIVLTSAQGETVEIALDLLEKLAVCSDLVMETDGIGSVTPASLSDFTEKELRTALARQTSLACLKTTNRTQRRHLQAIAMAKITGADELLALVPRTKERGNRKPRLTQEQVDAIAQVIREEYLTHRAPNKKACHNVLTVLCHGKGIAPPSYPTLIAHIKALSRLQSDRARHGKRVAYQNAEFFYVLSVTTPVHGVRPFQIVHMDHTELDIELVSSRTGKNLGRPWLSLAVDAFTRRILGFYLSFDPPSYRSNMMLLRDIVRRYQRLPQMIVVDNGADFRSENFQLIANLFGIHLRYRPAGHARHGAVLERLFGTLHTKYIHNLAGNTKATKIIRQTTGAFLPSRLADWTLEALYFGIQYWATDYYDQHDHSALDISPREAFARGLAISGDRPHRLVTLTRDLMILTCPLAGRQGMRKVDRQRGIKFLDRNYYWCPEMASAQVAGTKVLVRYDPWDASTVYVRIGSRWVSATCRSLASIGMMPMAVRAILSAEYAKRHPHTSNDELSIQRLSEFIRVFTPEGAMAVELERQEENRQLYEYLHLGAVTPHQIHLGLQQPSEARSTVVARVTQPAATPCKTTTTKSSTPLIEDVPDFDTF